MGVDRTTETIAHFIGLFETEVDEVRMREGYEAFKAFREGFLLDQIEALAVASEAELDPPAPPVKPIHMPLPDSILPPLPDAPPPLFSIPLPAAHDTLPPDEPRASPEQAALNTTLQSSQQMIALTTPLGSFYTMTVQTIRLRDDDVIGDGAFRDAAAHAADLQDVAAVAAVLHVPSFFASGSIPDGASTLAAMRELQAFGETPLGALAAVNMEGGHGSIVNGAAVAHLPEWQDSLPQYHQDAQERQEADAEPIIPDWAIKGLHTFDEPGPEGHSIVAGGNLLSNEAHLTISWIDAPAIVVGGDWIDLDVVSQVAMLSDRDMGARASDAGSNTVLQSVLVSEEARLAPWQEDRDVGATTGPVSISISHLTGDLLTVNHVTQVIEMTDNDQFGMTITAANSAFILGGNEVQNAMTLNAIGTAYDLILVGGDFVSLNTIHQTLVLQDDDRIDLSPGASEPLLQKPTLAGTATPGEETQGEGVRGIPPDLVTDGPEDRPAPDEMPDDGAPEVTAAEGNLLMNEVKLTQSGVDVRAELSEGLANIFAGRQGDMEALREKLMSDPLLAGLEHARILKIDGDLIQANVIEQIVHASDRDHIRVDGPAPAGLEVFAGSNALLNAASVDVHGVDSTVMTRGEGYSDLLIHQARLIEENDSDPDASSELVSEAVAFLMDDIGAGDADGLGDVFAGSAQGAAADAYDLMNNLVT
ncbi:hypothetical protein JSE7799_02801 [Jannaschia seosinensis]|uniref:Type I secretion protein n=1 Tax=Jannaschia seosinensis TaxID=313367 RepID=A0A0M7BE67_9RHOB|nr:hypothetical protein [Jannaschia seosinensis]CUH40072.1 hypothetical protein JSE7799_02801 [Jannaschia seosinensis]